MRISRDRYMDYARPLNELIKTAGDPALVKSARLAAVEFTQAWSRAGWEKRKTFDFTPSRRAEAAWAAIAH